MKSLTKRPGEFRATCRRKEWLPYANLDGEQLDRAEKIPFGSRKGEVSTRWDAKLHLEVAAVPCAFETADRAEFERHMLEVHGKKLSSVINRADSTQSLSNRAKGKWKTPKAPAEYTPVKALEKAPLKTCGHCGLVAETDGSLPHDLWWREHIELCVAKLYAEERAS